MLVLTHSKIPNIDFVSNCEVVVFGFVYEPFCILVHLIRVRKQWALNQSISIAVFREHWRKSHPAARPLCCPCGWVMLGFIQKRDQSALIRAPLGDERASDGGYTTYNNNNKRA